MRALAYVAGGIGLAGIGVGSYFGVRAISQNKDSMDAAQCPRASLTCAARDQAFSAATGSTASFAVGIAGLGAATALFFLSRPGPAPTGGVAWRLSPTAGGAALLGVF